MRRLFVLRQTVKNSRGISGISPAESDYSASTCPVVAARLSSPLRNAISGHADCAERIAAPCHGGLKTAGRTCATLLGLPRSDCGRNAGMPGRKRDRHDDAVSNQMGQTGINARFDRPPSQALTRVVHAVISFYRRNVPPTSSSASY